MPGQRAYGREVFLLLAVAVLGDEPVLLAVDEPVLGTGASRDRAGTEGALGTRPTEGDEQQLGQAPAFPATAARTSGSRPRAPSAPPVDRRQDERVLPGRDEPGLPEAARTSTR